MLHCRRQVRSDSPLEGIEGAAGRTCEYAEWRVRRIGLDYHVSERWRTARSVASP